MWKGRFEFPNGFISLTLIFTYILIISFLFIVSIGAFRTRSCFFLLTLFLFTFKCDFMVFLAAFLIFFPVTVKL